MVVGRQCVCAPITELVQYPTIFCIHWIARKLLVVAILGVNENPSLGVSIVSILMDYPILCKL